MEPSDNGVLSRVEDLEKRLERVERILEKSSAVGQPLSPAPTIGAQPGMPPKSVMPGMPWKDGKPAKPGMALKKKVASPTSGSDLEAKIGGTVLNRIAIVAILIGMSYFLKYAFDHQWIGPSGRIIIGIICGLALLGGGEYFQKKKYPVFAQGLSGGGIAVLYFSIFAAFQFYHLIPQVAAFLVMILITAMAVALSIRYSAQAIAIFGIIGGFCTPFLLSDGSSNYIVLFSYNILLNLGILTIAYFRDWKVLKYLSFLLTYLTFIVWGMTVWGNRPNVWITESFLTAFFIIYSMVAVFYHVVNKKESSPPDLVMNLLNAAVYFGLSYVILFDKIRDFMGFYAVGLAAYYLLLGYLAWQRNQDDKFTALSFWGLTLGFTTLAIPLQLDGSWISVGWLVEAVLLVWMGLKKEHFFTRIFGLVVTGLVGWNLLYTEAGGFRYLRGYDGNPEQVLPFLNWTSLDYLALITACFAVTWLYHSYRVKGPENTGTVSLAGLLAGNILLVLLLSKETVYTFDYLYAKGLIGYWTVENVSRLSLSGVWALYSIVLLVTGIIKRNQPIRLMSIVLLGITIIKVFLYDLANLDTLYRIFSFVGLGLILLGASFLYQKYKTIIVGLVVEEKQEGVSQ